MSVKSAFLPVIFLVGVSALASCSAIPYPLLPPAPVGPVAPGPVYGDWAPYGGGEVPREMPDRRVQQAPGWHSAAVSSHAISQGELPPVARVEPVDPALSGSNVRERIDSVRGNNSGPSNGDEWGAYRSTPVPGANAARPYSSRPVPPTASGSRLSSDARSDRVTLDPAWSKANIPADMRREVNTMVLQAVRAGSSRWIGLDGRNYSATASSDSAPDGCVMVDVTIGQEGQEAFAAPGRAQVCRPTGSRSR